MGSLSAAAMRQPLFSQKIKNVIQPLTQLASGLAVSTQTVPIRSFAPSEALSGQPVTPLIFAPESS
jgi:hypothetical protein